MISQHRSKRVIFPLFELIGPPCETPGCKGVLVDCMQLKSLDFFQCCSVCKAEFNRMPIAEKTAYARRTIGRMFSGEKEN